MVIVKAATVIVIVAKPSNAHITLLALGSIRHDIALGIIIKHVGVLNTAIA
jgi:hypothetical protein